MKNLKSIVLILFWFILVTGLIISLGFVKNKQEAKQCKGLEVNIDQENDLFFIDNNDIIQALKNRGDSIIGQPESTVNICKIERVLNSHPNISNAEVSLKLNGNVKVEVKQRKPVIRIFNSQGDSYYLDEVGKSMPLSSKYTYRTIVANGNINDSYSTYCTSSILELEKDSTKRYSTNLDELFALANYINNDSFWQAQISQIFVSGENDLELVPMVGNHKIIFGDTTLMKEKFEKLYIFYDQGLNSTSWWNKYSIINLKYKNQIVCTRK